MSPGFWPLRPRVDWRLIDAVPVACHEAHASVMHRLGGEASFGYG